MTSATGSLARAVHLWLLALAVALVMGFRAWASWRAVVPQVYADEAAYLAMGRLLGGGARWNLGHAATYGPGYSALLAPWFALDLDPPQVYRLAIWTNTVLAGCTVVAYEAVAARITPLRRPWTIAVAALAASLPALVLTANMAWSDNLTPLCFALSLLSMLRFLEQRDQGRGLVLALVVVGGTAAHDRFLPLAVVVLATMGWVAWRDHGARSSASTSAAVLVAGVIATRLVSSEIYDRLYQPGGRVDRLGEVDRVLRLGPGLLSVLGQSWYLLVTTAGLAGLGVVALAREWQRSSSHGAPPRGRPVVGDDRLPLVATSLLLGVAFATSVVFMTDRDTGHHLVYGRYNDAIAGVLVILGLGWLLTERSARSRWVGALAVAMAMGASVATSSLARGDVLAGGYNPPTILGLMAIHRSGPREHLSITIVGLVLLALIAAPNVGRSWRRVTLVVVAVLAIVGGVRGVSYMRGRALPHPEVGAGPEEILGPGEVVAYPVDPGLAAAAFYGYPFYAPSLWLEPTDGSPWEEGAPLILASRHAEPIRAAGYRPVWLDPHSDAALWAAPERSGSSP